MTAGTKLKLASPVSAPSISDAIARLSSEIEPKLIKWRRDIHQHPELSSQEYRTSSVVADHLQDLGLDVRTGVAETGVVGVLEGSTPGPAVALRADMDALPVIEKTGLPYASKTEGVMHACGHDMHTAILMGTADVLSKMRNQIKGSVKFIFQPAEEGPLEGRDSGAPKMISEGALENPKTDVIFGMHVAPLPTGMVCCRPGNLLASADIFDISIKGKQTHGAMPWAGLDPIVISAQIVLGLQSIISRRTNLTLAPAVISIGMVHGGDTFNIIPEQVRMTGTIRALDANIREEIKGQVKEMAHHIAKSGGCEADVSIREAFPISHNDPDLTQKMIPSFNRVVGDNAIMTIPPITNSDDFSFYQEKIPGLFFFLGATPAGVMSHPLHSPYFAPDENALSLGVKLMSNMAVDYLTLS